MNKLNIYREVKSWKIPLHASRMHLAKAYLKILPQLQVIGITGSVGKTLTQNAVYKVLSQKYKTQVGEENLDPTFRIPETILKAKPWDKYLILEYGVEHPQDMDHYLSIVKPDIAIITQIGTTHTKYFGNIEGVLKEKSKLIESLTKDNLAILNADDPLCHKIQVPKDVKTYWFGKKEGQLKISHFAQDLSGSKFRMHYKGQKASVAWKIVGKHQLTSAYAAATVGLICGLTLKQVAKGLSQVRPPVHRLNIIVTKNVSVIDDSYNASPQAAKEAISTLLELGKRRQKIAVLGEMKDLGSISNQAHRQLGEQIAKTKINFLITIGKTASIIADSARKNSFSGKAVNVSNTKEAIYEIHKIANRKSLILIKGSRHAHLERMVLGLLHKSTKIECYHCGQLN